MAGEAIGFMLHSCNTYAHTQVLLAHVLMIFGYNSGFAKISEYDTFCQLVEAGC